MSSLLHPTSWRPVAHVAIRDDERRQQIADVLHAAGWAVIGSRTGYHLIESIAGAILGERRWWQPGLVVVDAISPGCSGVSIARGLRDLGWSLPIVLVTASAEQRARLAIAPDDRLYVVEPDLALPVVRRLAGTPGVHLPSHEHAEGNRREQRMAATGRTADPAECSRL